MNTTNLTDRKKTFFHLEAIIINLIICLLVSVFYDWQAQLVLFLILTVAHFRLDFQKYLISIFSYYLFLVPTGLYKTVGYTGPSSLVVAAVSLAAFFFFSFIFIRHLNKHHFKILLGIGLIFIFMYFSVPLKGLQQFFKYLILFWSYNFIILLKEADHKSHSKKNFNFLFTLNAFWNLPYFLNLNFDFLEKYRCKNQDELRQARRNGTFQLIIATFICLSVNYCIHLAKFKSFYISNIYTDFLRINFTSLTFTEFSSYGLFANSRFEYLFAIISGGVITIAALLYMNTSAVCVLCSLGYRIPYPNLSISRLKLFSGYIQQLYYFYNLTLMSVFYPRINKIFNTLKIRAGKNVSIFSMIILGGTLINYVTDSVMYAAVFNPIQILKMTLESGPYFILLSTAICLGYSAASRQTKLKFFSPVSILLYTVLMSFIFSLHRPFIIDKSLSEFIDIYKIIF